MDSLRTANCGVCHDETREGAIPGLAYDNLCPGCTFRPSPTYNDPERL
jgi:hypothetical protein